MPEGWPLLRLLGGGCIRMRKPAVVHLLRWVLVMACLVTLGASVSSQAPSAGRCSPRVRDLLSEGEAQIDQEQYRAAIAAFDLVIQLDPQCASAYASRGLGLDRLKQHQQALQDLAKAIHLDPQSAAAYLIRGDIYARLEEYRQAIEDYSLALQRDPQLAQAYTNRGLAYYLLGDQQRSADDFAKAAQIDPMSLQVDSGGPHVDRDLC